MGERLVYKVTEAAELLNCSRAKAYEMVQSGELESIKVGKDQRVTAAGLQAYIKKQLKAATK